MTFGEKFNRRRFLQGGAACLGLALYQPRAALLLGVPSETVEVRTPLGFLRGAKENGVVSFKGVPYVGPVDGERRFRQLLRCSRGAERETLCSWDRLLGSRERPISESESRRPRKIV